MAERLDANKKSRCQKRAKERNEMADEPEQPEESQSTAGPVRTQTHGDRAIGGDRIGSLEHGHALPGEAALLAPECRRLEGKQPGVCRDLIIIIS